MSKNEARYSYKIVLIKKKECMFLHVHKTDKYGTNEYKATAWPYRGMERITSSKNSRVGRSSHQREKNCPKRKDSKRKKNMKKIKRQESGWAGTRDRGTQHKKRKI